MRFAAAICAALLCLCASGVPIGLRTAMWGDDVVSLETFELMFGDHTIVAFDDSDNIVVTLTNDVSGTVEIPDNVGAVTIDLNGHNMVGDDGALGETALPSGPAIRIVKGDGESSGGVAATRLAIVDTSEGEKGRIAGGGESAGIEVAEDAATGVKLDVEDGVGVFNGDGSEQELKPKLVGAGKVTTPKTWKVGQKVTWKATADKGSVFARWEGPLVDSLNLTKNERRNPSLAFAVPEDFETNMVTAVFLPIDDDGLYSLGITQAEFDLKETVSDVWVTDDSQSYVTATASGLPTGLKFNAKTLQITGAPTKGGVYWVQIKAKNASGYQWAENVKVTVSGDGKEAKEPKLTRTAYHPLTVICATEGGTASGTGVYAEGKKVTIKATPAKGYVFAGWYETAAEAKDGGRGAIALTSSMSVVVPEMRYVFAKFVTADEDRESIRLEVSGVEMEAAGAGRPPYQTNIWAGMYVEWPVAASALSETKVKVAGLPAGLKFTDKDIMKNGSKTEVEIPANTIYGAPTAASKIGRDGLAAPYQVKITVTTAGKASQTYQVGIVVDALPAWAVGTFNGGLANVTVAANGKISGKLMKDGETWTLSGAAFETICEWRIPYNNGHVGEEEGLWRPGDTGRSFGATVVAKYGKSVATNYVEVSETRFADATSETGYRTRGVATVRPASAPSQDSVPMEWTAWQNLWRTEPWKTMAKAFAKAPALEIEIEDGAGGTVTLKFAASGAVTASGKFVTGKDARGRDVVHSATCSSVLIPDEDGAPAAYRVHIYFPPKAGKFEGHAADIPLVWNGDAFGAR
ncbi:MAG: putative Ig domain-containing protein [Kiritimatiellae bacterium]|nr:putative Ig domain-containing protein [Kiritimatiellia bacterium]